MKAKTPIKPKRPDKKFIAALREVFRLTANCKTIGEEMDAVGWDPNLFFTWAYFSPRRIRALAEKTAKDPKQLETLKLVLDLCPEVLDEAQRKNAIPEDWKKLSFAECQKVPKARTWLKRYRAQLAAAKQDT